jgi:hypothetical protein
VVKHRSVGLSLLGLALVLAGSGCSVDNRVFSTDAGAQNTGPAPPEIVVDNFDDPEDPRFQPWQFYAYNTTIFAVSSPEVQPGYDSNLALDLIWEVVDPPDGQPNYPGVGIEAPPVGALDLSKYSAVLFAQQYAHSGSCKAVTILSVGLGCSQYNASFNGTVPMSSQWTTSTVPFSSFSQSPYPSATPVAMEDCFKVVDGFNFTAQVDLADGDCASGDLALDNIAIR